MPMLKIKKRLFSFFIAFIAVFSFVFFIPSDRVYAYSEDSLYLGGFPAGFVLETQNVEIIGLCEVATDSGSECPARAAGLKSGDIIESVNGIKITSASQLNEQVNEDYNKLTLTILRGGERSEVEVTPAIDENSGKKRLGMLVKDSLNGIGTVTYVNRADKTFGALGHPVSDSDGEAIKINGGTVYSCSIYGIKKGLRGNPGELKGIFDNGTSLGKITKNCTAGLFGEVAEGYDCSGLTKIKKASAESATMGSAYIYSTLDGKTAERYEVSIVKVDITNKENKNYVIKVNDKRLIDEAGGIVQGMSGSPIVQNGKLIGAVTHVFINDPTRGYGISLDKMLSCASSSS